MWQNELRLLEETKGNSQILRVRNITTDATESRQSHSYGKRFTHTQEKDNNVMKAWVRRPQPRPLLFPARAWNPSSPRVYCPSKICGCALRSARIEYEWSYVCEIECECEWNKSEIIRFFWISIRIGYSVHSVAIAYGSYGGSFATSTTSWPTPLIVQHGRYRLYFQLL